MQRQDGRHGRFTALSAAIEQGPVCRGSQEIPLPRIGLYAKGVRKRYAVQGEPEVVL